MFTVLFACVHNAGRSQMAAAFFNALADATRARALSAGTVPVERVHPVVVMAMKEVAIDLSAARPTRLTRELASTADLLITMGCGDACPVVPGLRTEEWPLEDPADRPLHEVGRVRNAIEERVRALIAREGCGKDVSGRGAGSDPGARSPSRS